MISKLLSPNKWHLTRTIEDNYSHKVYHGTGKVDIVKLHYGFELHEEGFLKYEDGEVRFNNSYTAEKNKNNLSVYLSTGALFFELDIEKFLDSGIAHVEHMCGNDFYMGDIKFEDNFIFVEWHVRGPHKSYISYTKYYNNI